MAILRLGVPSRGCGTETTARFTRLQSYPGMTTSFEVHEMGAKEPSKAARSSLISAALA
jgi:hypothetical protein